MSFEEKDGADLSPLWDWRHKRAPQYGREPQFNPLQLQLPLGAEALRESPAAQPQSSASQLPDFLHMIGVSEPDLVALELIREFRSLPELLAASTTRIRARVGSRVAQAIQTTRELMKATLVERVTVAPVVPRSAALIDFLTTEIGFLEQERLLSLYVNSELRLMRIETIADGDSGQVLLYARKIISFGLAIGAAGYVLVHNHPSGISEPSNADLAATSHMRRLSAELGLRLIDHLIIARGRFGSIDDHWRESRWSSEGSCEGKAELMDSGRPTSP
jgi:DNA repair protein RadC